MFGNLKLIVFTAFAAFFMTAFNSCAFAQNAAPSEILSSVDNYQQKYFTIIKRNDVLLNFENEKKLNKDRKELKKLFKEVTKQISNKQYLKEFKDIQKRYAKCEEITTVGINSFAQNNYNEADALLNKVYKEVKSKISSDDFKQLTASEQKWLKEIQDYEKNYTSKDTGTIGVVINYDCQTNMKEFRTLLLMMYL